MENNSLSTVKENNEGSVGGFYSLALKLLLYLNGIFHSINSLYTCFTESNKNRTIFPISKLVLALNFIGLYGI